MEITFPKSKVRKSIRELLSLQEGKSRYSIISLLLSSRKEKVDVLPTFSQRDRERENLYYV